MNRWALVQVLVEYLSDGWADDAMTWQGQHRPPDIAERADAVGFWWSLGWLASQTGWSLDDRSACVIGITYGGLIVLSRFRDRRMAWAVAEAVAYCFWRRATPFP